MPLAEPEEHTPTGGELAPVATPLPRSWFIGAVVGLAALGGAYGLSLRRHSTIAGLRVAGQPIGGVAFDELPGKLQPAVDAWLDQTVTLTAGKDELKAKRREVGFVVDQAAAVEELRRAGRTGHPWSDLATRSRARRGRVDLPLPVDVDRTRALEFLTNVKDDLDRAAVDARLDLQRHTIAAESPGYLVRVYDSMVALEYAARSGESRIALSAATTPARVTADDLRGVDISTVLG